MKRSERLKGNQNAAKATKRTHRVALRLSDQEHGMLQELSKTKGVSEVLREALVHYHGHQKGQQ